MSDPYAALMGARGALTKEHYQEILELLVGKDQRIEELERQLKECGRVLTQERAHNRDLVAHANATWQCVLEAAKTTGPSSGVHPDG